MSLFAATVFSQSDARQYQRQGHGMIMMKLFSQQDNGQQGPPYRQQLDEQSCPI